MDTILLLTHSEADGSLPKAAFEALGAAKGLGEGHASRGDYTVQSLSGDMLHDDDLLAVDLGYVVDDNDVGMVESGGRLRLLQKTAESVVV